MKKDGDFRLRSSKLIEVAVVADILEPKLLKGVAVYVVRTRLGLLWRLRRLRVLLRLQLNRAGLIYSGVCTSTVVRVVGMTEPGTESGLGRRSGLGTMVGMSTGLRRGVGTGIGMLGLLL